jgi:hypothetical protein
VLKKSLRGGATMLSIQTVRLATSFLILSIVILFAGCPNNIKKSMANPKVQEAFAKIFEQRQLSESAVAEKEREFKNKPENLQDVKKHYNTAAAKGNAFIEIVQLNLTAGSLQESGLGPRAKEVVEAVYRLQEYPKPPARAIPAGISDLIVGLTNAGIAIWKETKNEQLTIVENVKKELEKRKWKKYEELPR